MAAKIGGLGKGLEALFAENGLDEAASAVTLKVSEIRPNKEQPRKTFNDESLSELAASITRHGILQPLLVRPLPDGTYQLVAGERRFRAAHIAGLSEVPVVIKQLTEKEAAQIALIENLQREDLNPMEEARGYRTLMETYGMTQEETAEVINKSRPAIANALRLLRLPEEIAELVQTGTLSAGHARTLLAFEDPEQQKLAAKAAVEQDLSVRALEKMAKAAKRAKKEGLEPSRRDSFYDEVQLALTETLGRKVRVTAAGENKGVLQIEFYGKEDLQTLANQFAAQE